MTTFDATEYERWLETAREDVRVARYTAEGGFHHAAVLYAEQAAQCALKALLHAVGAGQEARGHGLLSLADACERWAGLELGQQQREALGDLALSYQTSRYPDALPEGTPSDHYGAGAADKAIETAVATLKAVEAAYADLRAADPPARDGLTTEPGAP
ncbi:MAG TPA: HEPN domain-containing protein [Egibacteraceae bacterium]|nr:HEPN domain-containing protein [Egibacteraceae bacterium]